jgi:CRISPR system Cascade subunit CasC
MCQSVGTQTSVRTKILDKRIKDRLVSNGVSQAKADEIATVIITALNIDKDVKKRQIIALSPGELARIDQLSDTLVTQDVKIDDSMLLLQDTAVDTGMFGRMLAKAPQYNHEAAIQVAHAHTTNAVSIEDDYFTAVDELQADDTSGAAHIGEAGFLGGSVFYKYISIDYDLLLKNLNNDVSLTEAAIRSLIQAIMTTTPSGKQNTFANHTLADYVMVERGSDTPSNGSAAFLKPVVATQHNGGDLLRLSIERFQTYRHKINTAYGLTPSVIEFDVGQLPTTVSDVLTFVV